MANQNERMARALIGLARQLEGKKGEVPEAFKKQWKKKDRDGDGKEGEGMPDFLKKKLEKKSSDRAVAEGLLGLAKALMRDDRPENRMAAAGQTTKAAVASRLLKLAKSLMAEEDVLSFDVPLLIRIMEYSKEDAETDMDLHVAAERMLELASDGRTLTMADYDAIVGGESGD